MALLEGPVLRPLIALALPMMTIIPAWIRGEAAGILHMGRLETDALESTTRVFPF